MTDTDETDPQPEATNAAYDPLMALTPNELATGSRHLKASVWKAITDGTQDYERALAVVLWLHKRRQDPAASFADAVGLSMAELSDQLDELGPEQEGPTTPTPSP